MEQPDHDIEAQTADTGTDGGAHDEVRPLPTKAARVGARWPPRLPREPWASWLPARSWAGEAQA